MDVQNNQKVTVNSVQQHEQRQDSIGRQIWDVLEIVGSVLLVQIMIVYSIFEKIYRTFIPAEPKSVKDEIVLITGTGHGIGKELALLYASQGATVVGWDVNAKSSEETIKEINNAGYPKAYSYVCDVSNRKNVLEVAKKVQEEVGDVTILINNAGIMPTHPVLDQTQDEIERVFNINVLAHFWTIQAFLPAMIRHNHGHIVALSSIAGLVGLENLVPYCGTKFAVRGMMEALHEELRLNNRHNKVETTIIFPYMVNTGLCKKPRVKFEKFMPLLEPKFVAETIMKTQRANEMNMSIPSYIAPMANYGRLLPFKGSLYLKDFIDSGVDSDL